MKFNNQRFLTSGVDKRLPPYLQIKIWDMIGKMPEPKDYLQVFTLCASDDGQRIIHEQEVPVYRNEVTIPCGNPINEKIFVIDSEDYSTMLFADEY